MNEKKEKAILIVDLRDNHYCKDMTSRFDALAVKINDTIERLRGEYTIVHAPAQCIGTPKKRLFKKVREAEKPSFVDKISPPCPCLYQCKKGITWKEPHPAIRIDDADIVSDDAGDIMRNLRERKVKEIYYVGGVINMCFFNRAFGVHKMYQRGFDVIIVSALSEMFQSDKEKCFSQMPSYCSVVKEL